MSSEKPKTLRGAKPNSRVRTGVNDILTLRPDMAIEWHPTLNGSLKPHQVILGYRTAVWWMGACGHEWLELSAARARRGANDGCRVCSKKILLCGFNDMSTEHPVVAELWDFDANASIPSDHFSRSKLVASWVCPDGHKWTRSVRSQVKIGAVCGDCNYLSSIPSANKRAPSARLTVIYRNVAAQWDIQNNGGRTADEFKVNSKFYAAWKCDHGHRWKANIQDRTVGGQGCPACSGKRLIVGVNDFESREPAFALEWHPTKNGPLRPCEVKFSSNQQHWWQCRLLHEFEQSPNKRNSRRIVGKGLSGARHMVSGGCPTCSGYRLLPGFNDLGTLRPDIAAVWHPTRNGDLTPRDVKIWDPRRVWWICGKSHAWQTQIATKVNKDGGCPRCRKNYNGSKIESSITAELALLLPGVVGSEVLPVQWSKQRYASVDAYIPRLRAVIEYDGGYWHAERVAQDTAKTLALIAAGYTVIRIRDRLLVSLDINLPQYIEVIDGSYNPAVIATKVVEELARLAMPASRLVSEVLPPVALCL